MNDELWTNTPWYYSLCHFLNNVKYSGSPERIWQNYSSQFVFPCNFNYNKVIVLNTIVIIFALPYYFVFHSIMLCSWIWPPVRNMGLINHIILVSYLSEIGYIRFETCKGIELQMSCVMLGRLMHSATSLTLDVPSGQPNKEGRIFCYLQPKHYAVVQNQLLQENFSFRDYGIPEKKGCVFGIKCYLGKLCFFKLHVT